MIAADDIAGVQEVVKEGKSLTPEPVAPTRGSGDRCGSLT